MKEIEFETSKGRFLVVDGVGEDFAHMLVADEWFIKLSEITENQASKIVDDELYDYVLFRDHLQNYCETAIESLHSLLKSKGIYLYENPYAVYDISTWHNIDKEKQEAEEKTFYNPYIFKL